AASWPPPLATSSPTLSESISRLQFAAIELDPVRSELHTARCPGKIEIRPQWKNNLEPVHFCFNARPLTCRRQSERHVPAENRWICLADQIAEHGMNHFGFHQKGHRVRPGTDGDDNFAAAAGKPV